MNSNYSIQNITKDSRKWNPWLLKKHYAKRIPAAVRECFGVFIDNNLIGVCVFCNVPVTLEKGKNVFTTLRIQGFELSRLVIIDGHEKNLLSHFVSTCLNEMKIKYAPCFIVSYADANMNHHGYIYQSTNWIYTGMGGGLSKFTNNITGKEIHGRHIYDTIMKSNDKKENITVTKVKGKHRYFYFLGSSRECKKMRKNLKYTILPYPKGENKKYDASYEPKSFSLFE